MDEWLRLLDDARADDAGRARVRERRLRARDEESATLLGLFVDLAERGALVRVGTTSGRSHVGPVHLAATDFVVIGDVWLAVGAIASVRTAPGERADSARGDRSAVDLRLVEALGRIAHERPLLTLVVAGGETVSGELRSVGADVVTLRVEGEPSLAYVPSASMLEVVLRSG